MGLEGDGKEEENMEWQGYDRGNYVGVQGRGMCGWRARRRVGSEVLERSGRWVERRKVCNRSRWLPVRR